MSTQVESLSSGAVEASSDAAPVTLAVVGAGYWGRNLVRNALQADSIRLTAVCDANLATATRLLPPSSGHHTMDDLQELLDDPSLEAIAVATPPNSHLDVAMAAIEAGKHVLVEK